MNSQMKTNGLVARCLQIALLGMVKSSLRAVYFNIENETVFIKMLYDRAVGEEEIEIASEIETEMLADYFDIYKINIEALQYDGVLNQAYKGFTPAFVRWERN